MPPILLSMLTFLAVALTIVGGYSILSDVFIRDRARVGRRVDDEFRKQQRDRVEKSTLFKNLNQLAAESGGEDRAESSLRFRFIAMIDQSGLDLEPKRLLVICAIVAAVLGVIGSLLRGPIVGTAAAIFGGVLPILYVNMKRKKRLDRLRGQLPDAFDLMSRVVRAGQTITQAISAVGDEFEEPIAAEFIYCREQQNLGLSSEAAFHDLGRRTGLVEVKIFIMAMLVQQQTGGNLAEMLDKLATVLRERSKIRDSIKSMTAEGRMQAIVLLAMPPCIFVLMFFLNNSYAMILFQHPKLILGTIACEGVGALWIRKIVNFDF